VTQTKAAIHPLALPQAPDTLLREDGSPRFGVFSGIPDEISFETLGKPYAKNRLGEFLRHKKWMYFFATTDEVIVAGAIVDAGPTGTCFVMVTDRATGEVLADASRPGAAGPLVKLNDRPLDGHRAHYLFPATLMSIDGEDLELRIQATLHKLPFVPLLSDPWLDLDLRIVLDPHPGIVAVTEVAGRPPMVTATAKNAALPTRGQLTISGGGRNASYNLGDGLGGFDYTNGYLPRETHWNWAYGMGAAMDESIVGFNLVSGFSGIGDNSYENMIWIDGEPHRLDPACRFEVDLDSPMRTWRITTMDRAVDLQFKPLAVHHESLNLGALRSRFIQPSGHFTGSIRVGDRRLVLDAIPGVAEDQDVLW